MDIRPSAGRENGGGGDCEVGEQGVEEAAGDREACLRGKKSQRLGKCCALAFPTAKKWRGRRHFTLPR